MTAAHADTVAIRLVIQAADDLNVDVPHEDRLLIAQWSVAVLTGRPMPEGTLRAALRVADRNRSVLAAAFTAAGHQGALGALGAIAAQADTLPAADDAHDEHGPAAAPVIRVNGQWIMVTAHRGLRATLNALPGVRTNRAHPNQWAVPATPAGAQGLDAALVGTRADRGPEFTDLLTRARAQDDARAVLDPTVPMGGDGEDPAHPSLGLPPESWERVARANLWEHQRRAALWMSRSEAALLAVPMGGGKSASTIATLNLIDARRVLVICPAKVVGVWPREMRRHSPVEWHIVNGRRPAKGRRGKGPVRYVNLTIAERVREIEHAFADCTCGKPHLAIVNYEALAHAPFSTRTGGSARRPVHGHWVPPVRLDAIVYDEAHRLKSPTGVVSKAAAALVPHAARRYGLTGTPIPQHPWDAWGLFRALDPGIYGTVWTGFKAQFLRLVSKGPGVEVPDRVLPEMLPEFSRRFFSITYQPVVDLHLPPAVDTTVEVDLEPKARTLYDALEADSFADLSEHFAVDHSGDVDTGSATMSPANIMVMMLRLAQITGGFATLDADDVDARGREVHRTERVSTAKDEALEEVLGNHDFSRGTAGITGGKRVHGLDPVVVFCRFRADLDGTREVAERMGLTYGEVSGRSRTGLSEDSTLADGFDVVGVQIASGGTGVDFTKARVAVWRSLSYSLSEYLQARARLHRPGQERSVLNVHLVATDTIDADVYAALERREQVIESVLRAHGLDPLRMGLASMAGVEVDPTDPALIESFSAPRPERRPGSPGNARPAPTQGVSAPLSGDLARVYGIEGF